MKPIRGLRRLDETTLRLGGEGDNWHTTWADDGRQFTALCDGRGWPDVPGYDGQYHNARVFAVHGDPPALRFEYLPGYPSLYSEQPPRINRYYGFGILALEGRIYHYLSTPNRPFSEPEPRFVGVKLIYSPDNGQTWRNQDGGPVRWESWAERSRANMVFFEEGDGAFALLTVLQMGRNYRYNTDGYMYVYGPNGSHEGTMNQLVMFRVPKGRILDRAAYEFYAGRDVGGDARWSPDIDAREPVHTFPAGWVNTQIHPYAWHPSVVYHPSLGGYLMANWGMGCAPDGMWFGKPSYLGFWVAEQPWGPWEQIHEETAWMPAGDPGARAYQPQIVPKWIAEDGRSFWLVWTDFQEIDGRRPYYAYNLQRVEVLA